MTEKIKAYLEKNKKINNYIFWKFYINPELFFKETTKRYIYNEIDSENIYLNEDFCEFLKQCLNDIDFIKKLDDQTLDNIRYELIISKEIVEATILDDIYKINLKKETLSKCYLNYLITNLSFQRDYLSLVDYLIKKITLLEEEYCEKNILPKLEKENIFKVILKDNYKNISNCFLTTRHGNDSISIKYLVCDNDFLELINNYLLDYNLPNNIIDNIIKILNKSINFKIINITYPNYWYEYQSVGKEKILSFHEKDAIKLIEVLNKKKKSPKIISINTKKRTNYNNFN